LNIEWRSVYFLNDQLMSFVLYLVSHVSSIHGFRSEVLRNV
jgi:hypothetical protein